MELIVLHQHKMREKVPDKIPSEPHRPLCKGFLLRLRGKDTTRFMHVLPPHDPQMIRTLHVPYPT